MNLRGRGGEVRVRILELSSTRSQFIESIITSQSFFGLSFLFRKRFDASFCMSWGREINFIEWCIIDALVD